jgi:hypothetical protein
MEITSIFPIDVIESITKCLDVQSIPKFRCCCKDANIIASQKIYTDTLIQTVNKKLLDIIETISEYHKILHNHVNRTIIIRTILNEFYLNMTKDPELHITSMIYMIRSVIDKTGCNENDVNRVWFLYMNNFRISNEDIHIVRALEDYTFGKWYSLVFQFTDCKKQGKHYIQLEMDLNNESKPELWFTMQEVVNEKDICKEDMENLLDIAEAKYDENGFIRFEISQHNILAMSEFIVNFMGPDVFVFKTDMVSYIKCHGSLWHCFSEEFIEKQVNKFVDREHYRDRVIEILDNLM